MSKQYRTLGEGDVRLPGAEYDEDRRSGWRSCPPPLIGALISRDDAEAAAYRAPCSATIPPGGYEVVDRARLPEGARIGEAWLFWDPVPSEWLPTGYFGMPINQMCEGSVPPYAAPAEELAALYAQSDAEREQPAPVGDGWRLLGDDELIAHGDETSEGGAPWKEIAAFEYHRAAGVFGAHNRYRRRVDPQPVEQPATAPASPWVSAAVRQPPPDMAMMVRHTGDDVVGVYYRHGAATMRPDWYWLDLNAVDRLAAENAELRAEMERRGRSEQESRAQVIAANQRLLRTRESARVFADRMAAERDAAGDEVERLRAEVADAIAARDAARMDAAAAIQRSAEARAEVERLRAQLAAVRAAVEVDHG